MGENGILPRGWLEADMVHQMKASGASKEMTEAEVKILKELKAKLGVAEPCME